MRGSRGGIWESVAPVSRRSRTDLLPWLALDGAAQRGPEGVYRDYFDVLEDEWTYHRKADAEGHARFAHLAPSRTYAVWAIGADPGQAAFATGVRPGPARLRLRPEASGVLRCRVVLPEHSLAPTVTADSGDFHVRGCDGATDSHLFVGLPSGRRWHVECVAYVQPPDSQGPGNHSYKVSDEADVAVPAACETEVVLRPRPRPGTVEPR